MIYKIVECHDLLYAERQTLDVFFDDLKEEDSLFLIFSLNNLIDDFTLSVSMFFLT